MPSPFSKERALLLTQLHVDNTNYNVNSVIQVYINKVKRAVLKCLELPEDYLELVTCNDMEADMHAVPLWMVRFTGLRTSRTFAWPRSWSNAAACVVRPWPRISKLRSFGKALEEKSKHVLDCGTYPLGCIGQIVHTMRLLELERW